MRDADHELAEDATDARKPFSWRVMLFAGLLAAGTMYLSFATDTNLGWLFKLLAIFSR